MRFGLVLLLSTAFIRLASASECTAYPKGEWKLTEASVLQFEQKWLEVLTSKNVAALDCMLAPEFKDTSRKGALRPKEQVLRELNARREQDQYQQNLTDTEANLFGDTAVIRGVNVISDSGRPRAPAYALHRRAPFREGTLGCDCGAGDRRATAIGVARTSRLVAPEPARAVAWASQARIRMRCVTTVRRDVCGTCTCYPSGFAL